MTAADSADEALRLVDGMAPDVVISDLAMPAKDGYELLPRRLVTVVAALIAARRERR